MKGQEFTLVGYEPLTNMLSIDVVHSGEED